MRKSPESGEVKARDLAERLDDPAASLLHLLTLWRQRCDEPDPWRQSVEPYRRLGSRALKLGAPFIALDVATEGLELFPRDGGLRQIQGLAWARSGAPEQANRILESLVEDGHRDEETLGMLARTYKDLAQLAGGAKGEFYWRKAQSIYAEAYRETGGYWTGINAATVATLLGDRDSACELACFVRAQCQRELQTATGDRYWLLATLAEADLNLEAWAEAEEWYRQAAEAGRGRFGDVCSTRRQARLLLQRQGRDCQWLDELLQVPRVAMFSGGRGGRHNCSPASERPIQGAIRAWLAQHRALVGYTSARDGSDLLFLETLQELHGEAHVVLPFPPERVLRGSLEQAAAVGWRERFAAVLDRAAEVVAVADGPIDNAPIAEEYAERVLHGLALQRARQLETDLLAYCCVDGEPGDSPNVERWRRAGLPIETLDLRQYLEGPAQVIGAIDHPPAIPREAPPLESRILAMLFADAVGFSKYTESQVVAFTSNGLGAIADLLRRSPFRAAVKETRGDGVYLAFGEVRDAGLFALDLCDLLRNTPWRDRGLPFDLSMRIGLHAGPVHRCYDPILESWTYTGSHVSRAARIEPIAPPGQVYASQAFAALAAVENVQEFSCDYVKQVEWAKHYGRFPTYVVRRRMKE
jgi:class 3 adenylate cyclase/tetratricopeptide (TPR) repeat protein